MSMSVYSKILELINGVPRTVDLASNILNVGGLEVGGKLLSQAGAYSSFTGTIAGTSTAVTITAYTAGSAGNSIALVFTGATTISAQIAAWNAAHPYNKAVLTSGDGSQTPSATTTSLSGGIDAGSSLIGDESTYNNFTPTSATVAGALSGIDSALAGLSASAITSLTGDVTATGPGAAVATLATVNSNVGSFGTASSTSTFTVNAKGLITAASNTSIQIAESQVTNLVSDLAGKQPTGNYITALTGDATAAGPGSAALTLATVNSNVGSFGSSTSIPSFTVNAKGLITAASGNAVVAPAGTLSGTTLNSTVVSSSLTSVGTITTGTWAGTTIAIAHGGTGQTSANAAFDALSPMTTAGDIIFENATPTAARLAIGSAGQVLTVSSGLPVWASPATSGTVTSVAFADDSSTPIYSVSGSPVTSTGTLAITLETQSANKVFAGPATGSAAQPTFRSLVSADMPDLSATYVTQSEVGVANGVASLDGSGKVPLSQLPSTLMEFKGSWNPNTNTPTLVDGTGTTGYTYWISAADPSPVSGLNDPSMHNFQIGDLVIYNGSAWVLVTPAAGVQSVNGAQGVVTVNAINQLTGDVTTSAASGSQSEASTVAKIQGTTVSGTTGSGNVVFSAAPTLTGLLSGGSASFSSTIAASNFSGSSSGTNTGDVTIGSPANGLSLSGQILSIALSSGSTTGALSSTDWSTFNSKLTSVLASGDIFVGNGSNVATAVAMSGDITINNTGATTIGAAKVTASKLATVTDGITLDQSGAGGKLEIAASGVSATQLSTGAFDQVTIVGGAGTAASVAKAPLLASVEIAGESLSAFTLVALRYEMSSDAGTAGTVYKADNDASSLDSFYVMGLAYPASSVSASGSVTATSAGLIQVPGHGFTPGLPLYLGSSGACTTTPPSAVNSAITKVGMVKDGNHIFVQIQVMGLN